MAQSSDNVRDDKALPALAAAFLVTFDNRKGYTIGWQKVAENKDLKLDGVVEFKSLPSGLHNVEEDLVYFVIDNYAGISAFLRQDDEASERNARMLSVGVLVPIEEGRMGKSFLYAPELKELAGILIRKDATYDPLDTFWDKHNKKDEQEAEDKQQEQASEGYQKTRVLSVSTLSLPGGTHSLPPHHPALALPDLLAAFGPLVFPLFRAALLQRRILILGEAPVEQMCDFVYNISILSSISRSLGAVLPHVEGASSRTRPLFCVGVADISTLEAMKGAWIACTTDDVLASKPQLFDLLVILPKSTSIQRTGNQTYPTMIDSTPELARTFPKHGLRATQRDARRYAGLKLNIQALSSGAASNGQVIDNDSSDAASSSSTVTILDQREAVEPVPWSVAAYTSLIWWVSAGDRRSGLMEAEEQANEQDEGLLHDSLLEESKTKEVTMIAYFQKLSALLFSVLANAVDRSSRIEEGRYHDDVNVGDDGTDRQPLLGAQASDDKETVEITEEDVRTMGLDIWSESDRHFILEMVRFWWKREATVRSTTIECCGVRIL